LTRCNARIFGLKQKRIKIKNRVPHQLHIWYAIGQYEYI
jgi:GTP cyclohydrolase II